MFLSYKASTRMKLSKLRSALVALMVIVFAITALSAQKDPKQATPKQARTDWTQYHWFDDCGNYLYRQSTVEEEGLLTGLDEMPFSPQTLWERGYAPAACTNTYPPVPFFPYFPNVRLYSHP